jgi:hypothetical protein
LITRKVFGDEYRSLSSFQRISPGPRLCDMFRNTVYFLRWGVVSTSPNPQVKDHP